MNIVRHLLFSIIISLEVVVFYDALNARVDKIACRKCALMYVTYIFVFIRGYLAGSGINIYVALRRSLVKYILMYFTKH